MNNLPVFKINETKTFKFSNEQYYKLEKEYNRYVYYKSLIKQIEKILNITDVSEFNNINNNNNRKKYENKNILDRFILECINHGITPYIEIPQINNPIPNLNNHNPQIDKHNPQIDNHNDNDNNRELNFELLSNNLFFNKILDNTSRLHNTSYYKKMLCEYNEKKIRITPEKQLQIDKIIIDTNIKFTKQCQLESSAYKTTMTSFYKSISCSITLQNNEYFIIKYREYIKIINLNRYYKIIKNYDKPYPYDIIRMLLRYSIFDMSSQQWSIGNNLYEDISEIFNISFEMFASPLNFNMNMFCSIFYDTDHIFGSIGSFYSLDVDKFLYQNIKGVFFNPPYLPLLMNNSINQCIKLLDDMNKIDNDFTVVSFLPNWDDAEYIKKFIGSKYTVDSRIINKGNYILQEKDKGKLINGTFDLLLIVLNSIHMKTTSDKKNIIVGGIDKIIDIMKIESKEAFLRQK